MRVTLLLLCVVLPNSYYALRGTCYVSYVALETGKDRGISIRELLPIQINVVPLR